MTAGSGHLRVAFCGAGDPSETERDQAEQIGFLLGSAGCVLYCGGLGGAMEAAARGAKRAGGQTVGILPGYDVNAANEWIDIPVCTGMGHARNAILVASVNVVIASGGGWGTLSEVALALKLGRPVVVHGRWEAIAGVNDAEATLRTAVTPHECVRIALELGNQR